MAGLIKPFGAWPWGQHSNGNKSDDSVAFDITSSNRSGLPLGYPCSTSHERERVDYWRVATPEMHGKVLAELLELVDSIGRFPPKQDMFPGFPTRRSTQGSSQN